MLQRWHIVRRVVGRAELAARWKHGFAGSRQPATGIRHQASEFDLRPSTFDLRPSTFDLRPARPELAGGGPQLRVSRIRTVRAVLAEICHLRPDIFYGRRSNSDWQLETGNGSPPSRLRRTPPSGGRNKASTRTGNGPTGVEQRTADRGPRTADSGPAAEPASRVCPPPKPLPSEWEGEKSGQRRYSRPERPILRSTSAIRSAVAASAPIRDGRYRIVSAASSGRYVWGTIPSGWSCGYL